MSNQDPTDQQKFNEALTAMGVALRIFVRALLAAVAMLVGRAPGPLPRPLRESLTGLFINYRNVTRESLRLHEAATIELQRDVGRLADRVDMLEAIHRDELAAAHLNTLEDAA